MSTIKVNTIETRTGSTLTLGKSGDTVSIASGASTSGMGRTGAVDWQTSSIKTESFTGVNGEGYFIDTSDGTPFKNYTTTVATGTLYLVGGSGNVFNLDGSQQTAITMLANKTYRFTQSNSSNDGHQLIISTSNSTTLGTFQAGIVSSGITYYIDGSATQSNWLNTTTFNAGTTRYIEYKPSSTGTYYFGCYNHGIGMGGAITVSKQTMTLPAGSAGAIVAIQDYKNTFDTNNLQINPASGEKINGGVADGPLVISTEGQGITFVYVDTTVGWKSVQENEFTSGGSLNIEATGGTITTCGNFKIHTFTSPGTFCVSRVSPNAPENVIDYVVVAGGGGGGASNHGGGAGAGGYRESAGTSTGSYSASPLGSCVSALAIPSATAYPVTVGAGGAGGIASPGTGKGTNGSDSVISSITSSGGGGGGSSLPTLVAAVAGGSGGGGTGNSPAGGGSGASGNTPPVSPPQGTAGGNGAGSAGPAYGAGGGGGATVAGSNGTAPKGGDGGAGATSSITGSAVARAGGGGGSSYRPAPGSPVPVGAGGTGGGAAGSFSCGVAGTVNTGGGGGGAERCSGPVCSAKNGGAGGSGVVIVRYRYQ